MSVDLGKETYLEVQPMYEPRELFPLPSGVPQAVPAKALTEQRGRGDGYPTRQPGLRSVVAAAATRPPKGRCGGGARACGPLASKSGPRFASHWLRPREAPVHLPVTGVAGVGGGEGYAIVRTK